MDFHESLSAGKASEELVLAWIKKKYPAAILINGYCKQCDIYVPEKHESVEVKQDKKSEHTGNWVVEVGFGGVPSALITSASTWWVFLDNENMYWVAPGEIKNCILYHGIRQVEFQGPGDSKMKRAYLVPKEILNRYVSFTVSISEN